MTHNQQLTTNNMPGLSLIELIVGVAIMSLLAAMLAGAYSQFKASQARQAGSASAASIFVRARSESVAGVDGLPHGVHIASTTLTLFEGSAYSAGGASNRTVALVGNLVAAQVHLAGGGTDVIFDQLTGTTGESGTVVLQAGSDSSRQKTITISAAGVVSVQ